MAERELAGRIEAPSALTAAVHARLKAMDASSVVERIWSGDHTVWKDDPTEITSPGRLGWLTSPDAMAAQVETLRTFAAEAAADGFTTCVLCGMGGSSLAPETLSMTLNLAPGALRLRVLDTTDPDAILAVERSVDLSKTLFLIASKSGTTVETRSHMEYFWSKVPNGRQFIAVTDPGSELERVGKERAFRAVFLAQSDIGGRYSALSHFGLVAGALAGVDLDRLLAGAHEMLRACGPDIAADVNPGAVLGAILGEAALAGRDKLTLLLPERLASLGSWAEQLIAESTGKEDKGIVPITGEPVGPSTVYGSDRLFVAIGDAETGDLEAAGQPVVRLAFDDPYELGGQFVLWEFATAVVGHIFQINPFDQPNVEEAKQAALKVLSGAVPAETTATVETVRLSDIVHVGDYIAIQAYVAPTAAMDAAMAKVRLLLRERFQVATSAGYGPRYLHSTGQLHKGGQDEGVFIQIVSSNAEDMPIPGRAFTFGQLKQAQARGDLDALRSRGRRVIAVQAGSDASAELMAAIEGLI